MIPLISKEYNEIVCCKCAEKFWYRVKKEVKEVKDHCSFTDKYRGTAYNVCNLVHQKIFQ